MDGDRAQTTDQTPRGSIHELLGESLSVGEPDVAGPLVVFPVFGPEPRLEYLAFAQAAKHGVSVTERAVCASVNELVIENPIELPVFLYEGEEVLGAQQNRIFDASLLVPARSQLTVPVSCVEVGRWNRSRHAGGLAPGKHFAYPELRGAKAARKAARAGQRLAAALEARADQGEVWSLIDSKARRHSTRSPSGAMHDIYEGRRLALDATQRAIRVHPGQSGTIAAIGGEIRALDYVSRPEGLRLSRDKVFRAPPIEWIRERMSKLQDVLEQRTPRSGLLLRELLGPIRLEPVSVDVGRPYYRALTSIDALALIDTPPEGRSEGGSNSLRRWRRRESNPRPRSRNERRLQA